LIRNVFPWLPQIGAAGLFFPAMGGFFFAIAGVSELVKARMGRRWDVEPFCRSSIVDGRLPDGSPRYVVID
jgi:hypothetical protein